MLRILFTGTVLVLGLVSASVAQADHLGVVGEVYTMTNAPAGNDVLVYERMSDGSLRFAGAHPTGGLGSGDGLGNQGGVVLSDDGRWLLVVNAGSDELSVFDVSPSGLVLSDTQHSGGIRPISVTIHGDLVYVLHAGGSVGAVDSIAGLRLSRHGSLMPLADSSRPLSTDNTGPAQIGFSPGGRQLLVTEKATSSILSYAVNAEGYATMPVVNPAAGMTPFAFDFGKRGQVFVSEVFGGAEDMGAVSSYRLERDGSLEILDPSVPNTETAPCWLVADQAGRTLYTTNTPDDSLSAYYADSGGDLTLRDEDGRTGETDTGARPLDMDLSNNGRFLYTLNIGNGSISTFAVGNDGSLEQRHVLDGVPAGVNGLAAR